MVFLSPRRRAENISKFFFFFLSNGLREKTPAFLVYRCKLNEISINTSNPMAIGVCNFVRFFTAARRCSKVFSPFSNLVFKCFSCNWYTYTDKLNFILNRFSKASNQTLFSDSLYKCTLILV